MINPNKRLLDEDGAEIRKAVKSETRATARDGSGRTLSDSTTEIKRLEIAKKLAKTGKDRAFLDKKMSRLSQYIRTNFL